MQNQTRRRKRRLITLSVRLMAAFIMSVMLITLAVGVLLIKDREALFIYADEKPPENKQSQEPAMIIIPDESMNAISQVSGDTVSGDEPEAEPMVRIAITEPTGWYNKAVKIKVLAEDIANTGNFTIKTVKDRIGQNGSWMDIRDSMSVDMSENGTIYVEVTDTKGKNYNKNARIVCFDFTKPTLNAAVNNGTLTLQASDTDSGIKAVYVNGFEFTNLTNGTLNIRMEQFDTGYQYFTVQAMDNAGNMSENYRVNNPYYSTGSGSSGSKIKLPDSAEATKPANSTAKVTDHITTDSQGNTLSKNNAISNTKTEEKKKALAEADSQERTPEYTTVSGQGREFYTIEAKTGKVFYLIIDRDGDNEEVHFVTDITENDLLNVTEDNSETLPKNAATLEAGEAAVDSSLPNNNNCQIKAGDSEGNALESFFGKKDADEEAVETVSEEQVSGNAGDKQEKEERQDAGGLKTYVFAGIIMLIVALIAVIVKKLKRRGDENFEEEEDYDPDEEGELPDDDESEDGEEDFYFFDEPPKDDREET